MDRITAYKKLDRSFFVSLTFPDYAGVQKEIGAACEGAHLVELRVDLLTKHDTIDAFKDFVTKQVGILKSCTDIDILYTVRTKTQGGAWPDDDIVGLLDLYNHALSLSVPFLDVEMQLPDDTISSLVSKKGSTAIIMSQHDWAGDLSWSNGSWKPWMEKGVKHGDAVKLVGTAKTLADNIALENFRAEVEKTTRTPLIAINMGVPGQISRILNSFMTPVTHPALRNKAAPGQLSVVEIKQAMSLMGLA